MNKTPESKPEKNPNFIPTDNLSNFVLQFKNQQMNHILQQKKEILTPEEFAEKQKEMQNLEKMRHEKQKILFEMTAQTPEQAKIRPKLNDLNMENFDEIVAYFARQNLACAFDCCADSDSAERTTEILQILKNAIPNGKFVHIGLFEDKNWNTIKLQNPQYASQFFEIFFGDKPQDKAEKQKILAELADVKNQFLKIQNDKK